jgi:beta-glucanase (GH16 family)
VPTLSSNRISMRRGGRRGDIKMTNHGWGDDGGDDGTGDASVTTATTNDYHTYNNATTFIKKHIICLIFCN